MKIVLINDCIPMGVCSSYKMPIDGGSKIKGGRGLNFKLKERICIKNNLEKNYNVTVFFQLGELLIFVIIESRNKYQW